LRAVIDKTDGDEENKTSAEATQRLPRRADIPEFIYALAEKSPAIEGITDLLVVRRPHDIYKSIYAAKVIYKPRQPGLAACADHYPMRFVAPGGSCSDRLKNDLPANGWVACGQFYTSREVGCPPEPQKPVAPLSTPRPKCTFGAERCKTELPGGPGYLRLPKDQLLLIDPAIASASVERPQLLENTVTAGGQTSVIVGSEIVRPELFATAIDSRALRIQRVEKLFPNVTKMCASGACSPAEENQAIRLPTPSKSPKHHTPCGYQHVRFFAPESRFCPKASFFEQPAPGYALFILWKESEPQSVTFYYHDDDHDGVIRTATMLFGKTDDRFPLSEATTPERAAAAMTAVIVKNDRLITTDHGTTLLDDPAWKPLCAGEKFAGLPRPGRCSGVKIGNRLVATSAHCMRNQRQCDNTSAIFKFSDANDSGEPRVIDAAHVYRCTSIMASRRPATFGERGADWAIFEVGREIDAPSASLAPSDEVRPGVVTTVIGHPMGLPTVITRLGAVQASTSQYFVANSDTFVGNSGSPVFGAHSVENGLPKVLGLLTGGRYDFDDQNQEDGSQCVTAKWCRDSDCLGDDVVYTNDLIAVLENQRP